MSTCQCGKLINTRATNGHCVIECGAEIEKNWVFCRPCAKGNHTGGPCQTYIREPLFPIVKSCRSCGFDSAMHDSSGAPSRTSPKPGDPSPSPDDRDFVSR